MLNINAAVFEPTVCGPIEVCQPVEICEHDVASRVEMMEMIFFAEVGQELVIDRLMEDNLVWMNEQDMQEYIRAIIDIYRPNPEMEDLKDMEDVMFGDVQEGVVRKGGVRKDGVGKAAPKITGKAPQAGKAGKAGKVIKCKFGKKCRFLANGTCAFTH